MPTSDSDWTTDIIDESDLVVFDCCRHNRLPGSRLAIFDECVEFLDKADLQKTDYNVDMVPCVDLFPLNLVNYADFQPASLKMSPYHNTSEHELYKVLSPPAAVQDKQLKRTRRSHDDSSRSSDCGLLEPSVSLLDARPDVLGRLAGPSPLDALPTQPLACIDSLSAQIYEFHRSREQSMASLSEKLHLRDLLYYAIAPHFTGCGLYIVGSTLNGFGSNTSDMDLCLMITPRDLDQRVDAILVLTSVMGHLKDLPWVKDMDLIFAKVPILRATFNPPFDKIVVDLNANNSVAIRNTHLLCYYSAFDWRVRPLVCAVKEWAKRRGINDANQSSLTSYSLVMMVIHYLQCGVSPPILPSLQQLFPDRFGNRIDVRSLSMSTPIDPCGWEPDNNTMSLSDLLVGVLHYYAKCFNFDTMAISVRLGRTVDRAYVVKNKSPFNSMTQWRCICIEEPFTYSNTAHSVFDERMFSCIKESFDVAYTTLTLQKDLNVLIHTEPIKLADGVPTGFRHFRVPVIRYDRDNHEATEKKIVQTVASFHMEKAK